MWFKAFRCASLVIIAQLVYFGIILIYASDAGFIFARYSPYRCVYSLGLCGIRLSFCGDHVTMSIIIVVYTQQLFKTFHLLQTA